MAAAAEEDEGCGEAKVECVAEDDEDDWAAAEEEACGPPEEEALWARM